MHYPHETWTVGDRAFLMCLSTGKRRGMVEVVLVIPTEETQADPLYYVLAFSDILDWEATEWDLTPYRLSPEVSRPAGTHMNVLAMELERPVFDYPGRKMDTGCEDSK